MPVSRSTKAVARSLSSVLSQTFDDFEVLVSDDGGHAREAVDQAGDRRVKYQRNSPPLGFIANHEAAIEAAQGDFIAFLHDDDLWERDYLKASVERLKASPRAGFAFAAHKELPQGATPPHPPPGCFADALPLVLDRRYRLLPSTTVIRREILADVRKPWPQLSCGDMVLYIDAAVAGWGAAVLSDALVSYVRHPDQISADEDGFRHDLARLFDIYAFDDPLAERLRRRRLAGACLSIARANLRNGRPAEARVSVSRALAAERGVQTALEGAVLVWLSRSPRLLKSTIRIWYRIRGAPVTAQPPR